MNPAIFSALASVGLAYDGVIVSGALHIATKDGEAMMFHDSIDWSAFAGTDGGYTPFQFVLTDAAGKVASAYGGAVGGGEALGAELITNGDFSAWTSDDPDDWVVSGEDVNNYITEDAGCARIISDNSSAIGMTQDVTVVAGGLYKTCFTIAITATGCRYGLQNKPSNVYIVPLENYTSDGAIEYIRTPSETTARILFYRYLGSASNYTVDDVSIKHYTDIPATGLHLMSAKNGTTRNMASVESGFNPNTVVSVKIYG